MPMLRSRPAPASTAERTSVAESGDLLVVESPTAEEALDRLSALLGPDVEIVAAEKVSRGGIGGFFAREMVQLSARRPPGAPPPPTAAPPASRTAPVPAPVPAHLSALLSSRSEGEDGPAAPVPAEEPTFAQALRRHLTAGGDTAEPSLSMHPASGAISIEETLRAAEMALVERPAERRRSGAEPWELQASRRANSRRGGGPAEATQAAPRRPLALVPDPEPVMAPVLPAAERMPAAQDLQAAGQQRTGTLISEPLISEPLISEPLISEPLISEPRVVLAPLGSGPISEEPVQAPPPGLDRPLDPLPVAPVLLTEAPGTGAVAWSPDELVRLGLPFSFIRPLLDTDPDDDLAWIESLAASARSLCRPLPGGDAAFVGARAGQLAKGLRLPDLQRTDRAPERGSICCSILTDAESRRWYARVSRNRWTHLVAGGFEARELLDLHPMAISWVGAGALPGVLRLATELAVPLGWFRAGNAPVLRATPIEVALGIRALVVRR